MKKFRIQWINDKQYSNDYFEIWSESELSSDFEGDKDFLKSLRSLKLGKSLIHFDCDHTMMVVTRVSSYITITD